jgi:hypothetical protein
MSNLLKPILSPSTGKPTKEVRYNGKCYHCGQKKSFMAIGQFEAPRVNIYKGNYSQMFQDAQGQQLEAMNGTVYFPHECPNSPRVYIPLKPVFGTYSKDHKCNDKCLSAIGHNCECQCGGKNHGASHS